MIFFWRGWGITVFFIPFVWIFILVGVMLGMDYYEPDPVKAAAATYRMFALAFALAAVTLFLIMRYRTRVAPDRDDFMFIPMKYWTWIVAVGAIGLYGASFFATDL